MLCLISSVAAVDIAATEAYKYIEFSNAEEFIGNRRHSWGVVAGAVGDGSVGFLMRRRSEKLIRRGRRRSKKQLRKSVCFSSLALVASPFVPSGLQVASAAAPRPIARSYYVAKNNAPNVGNLQAWGCSLALDVAAVAGTQQPVAVLGFGAQKTSTNSYTGLSTSASWTTADVAALSREFADGYAYCIGSDTSILKLAVTTNNSNSGSTTFAKGAQHKQNVNSISSTIEGTATGAKVDVYGGNDWEPGFGTATASIAWIDGFRSVGGVQLLINGSLDACPTSGTYSAGTACVSNNSWTVDQLYYPYRNGAIPLPQIYSNSLSEQWYRMSAYGKSATTYKLRFAAIMTQRSSCTPTVRPGCAGLDWLPDAGYDALQTKLNADPNTAYTIPGATDIAWPAEALAGTLPNF